MTGDWRTSRKRRRSSWMGRLLRPRWHFHDNLAEYRLSRRLARRVGAPAWEYVPRAHEWVVTDRGEGLVVDLITDHDGAISLTLRGYLWRHGLTRACADAIERLWCGLERHRIFAHGRPDNVVVRQRADGSCQCFAIDGFGVPQVIPLARWIPSQRRKRFRRRRAKQRREIDQLLRHRARGKRVSPKGLAL